MKILIVEDNPRHQEAARNQLKDHEISIVDNWPKARDLLEEGGFEAVLSDLMLPSTHEMLSDEAEKKFPLGTLMPLGFIVALHACLIQGMKYVAVISDSDHHSDPISAGLDFTGNDCYLHDVENWGHDKPEPMSTAAYTINGVKALFTFAPSIHNEMWVGDKGEERYPKNWALTLKILINTP